MRKTGFILILAILIFITSCATSVSYQTTRLPEWNTASIRSIAVIPFEESENTPLQRHASMLLNSISYSQIRGANHFAQVQVQTNENRGSFDAFFTGKVYYVVVNDNIQNETRVDQKDETEANYVIFERTVQIAFIYTLSDSNGIVIGTRTIEDLLTDYYELAEDEADNQENIRQPRGRRTQNQTENRINNYLKSPEVMVQEIIEKNMKDLTRDMVPYTVTERRSLMNENSKDKAVKQRSKEAASLVKAGNYNAAQNAFLDIYRDTGSYAAAFNAALVMTVQRQLNEALLLMQNVLNETGDQRAREEILRLQRLIDNENRAAAYRVN
ncbi:MAG: hypothetical protein LBU88_04710 [Treponema sp.]|jgi:hypothetical protein|nr:hypothetical protein [Treponema sp.]